MSYMSYMLSLIQEFCKNEMYVYCCMYWKLFPLSYFQTCFSTFQGPRGEQGEQGRRGNPGPMVSLT